jgi:putative peptide zinc metalloprotease protein
LTHFVERGGFVAERLARLVRRLRADGFLGPVPPDVDAMLADSLLGQTRTGRLTRFARRLIAIDLFKAPWADALLGAAYARGGWLLYTRLARVVWTLIIVVGLAAWASQVIMAQHQLFQTRGSYTLGIVTLAALDVLGIALYQIAQGLTLKRHGCTITAAGLQLYVVVPVVYVETSDVWMAGRRDRMAVSLAGPFAMLVLGGALALAAFPIDGTEMGAFLFKAAFVWLTNALFNLLPILDLDGYFLLVDYLEMPALRANALAFVREGLLPKLRARQPLTYEERVYTAYGIGYGLLVALVPLIILEARDLRYASSLTELWGRPDPEGKFLAAATATMLLGPALLSILSRVVSALLALGSMAIGWWSQHVRQVVPREYIEALASLPFLRDVPRAELRTVARHLDRVEVEADEVIVRQGAVGDRFYVIRAGDVRVVRLTADGTSEMLATLGPGDYFGEAALVANVPRTATVIAESPARLLTLDAGHFRRWMTARADLHGMVRRTIAEREVLAAIPFLATLGPPELDRLVRVMLVTRYSPGDRIVEQGSPGDRFYVLTDGRVEVVYEDGDRETPVAELGVGDFFGEMALLHDAPRSATVRALSPVETYTLSADDFKALLRQPPADAVRQAAHVRAHQLSALAGQPPPG